jgi:hypothetical protein
MAVMSILYPTNNTCNLTRAWPDRQAFVFKWESRESNPNKIPAPAENKEVITP